MKLALKLVALLLFFNSAFGALPTATSRLPTTANVTVNVGSTIEFSVNARDPDGDLKGVSWYVNGVYKTWTRTSGRSAIVSRSFALDTAGQVVIKAAVFDARNNYAAVSPTWTINVVQPNRTPTASMRTPSQSVSRVGVGQMQKYVVTASDPDGNLAGAEWYVDGNYVATTTAASGSVSDLEFTWTGTTIGRHSVIAVPFDKAGAYTPADARVRWTSLVIDAGKFGRGMYVSHVDSILDDAAKTTELLEQATWHGFDQVALYLSSTTLTARTAAMDAFLKRAHREYGLRVSAIGGSIAHFDKIDTFMNTSTEKFDALRSEFEFWNNGDYDGYIAILKRMREIADKRGLIVETYLGHFGNSNDTTGRLQALEIARLAHHVQLHAYRKTPDDTYAYVRRRLGWFRDTGLPVTVEAIFSVEDARSTDTASGGFMYEWVRDHSVNEAEKVFFDKYAADAANANSQVRFAGFQYFKYSFLLEIFDQAN